MLPIADDIISDCSSRLNSEFLKLLTRQLRAQGQQNRHQRHGATIAMGRTREKELVDNPSRESACNKSIMPASD